MGSKRSEPVYIAALHSGALGKKVEMARQRLAACDLCPRDCGVDRRTGAEGICQTGSEAIVASWDPHFGEEAPLVGRHGSGTIFFSHCNLGCNFCQNYDISHRRAGRAVSAQQLADIMLALQKAGCHNINFVTPSHVVPQILAAVALAAEQGLCLPLIYNSGGYDRVDTLQLLAGVIDIYMPDFKFWDPQVAQATCQAPDYPRIARHALREMHRQVGDLKLGADGIALRGLLLRHLVLPGGLAGTEAVMAFIAGEISTATYVNIMGQYRPCGTAAAVEALDRMPTAAEIDAARQAAREAGLNRLDRPRRVFVLR